jgi:hypothetical protein
MRCKSGQGVVVQQLHSLLLFFLPTYTIIKKSTTSRSVKGAMTEACVRKEGEIMRDKRQETQREGSEWRTCKGSISGLFFEFFLANGVALNICQHVKGHYRYS